MRKIFTILLATQVSLALNAQVTQDTVALQLIRANLSALDLTAEEADNSVITATYNIENTGIRMVYLQQTHLGLQVLGQVQTIAFKNGKPVSSTGGRMRGFEKYAEPATAAPVFSASDAVRSAINDAGLIYNPIIQPTWTAPDGNEVRFGNLGISKYEIVARLIWTPVENGPVKLSWEVDISPKNSSDHWLYRVNTNNNQVINRHNLTVSCNWHKSEDDHSCYEPALESKSPSTTQTNLQVSSPRIINGASYMVIPFPAESPQHPGGTPAIRTNPWLLAPAGSNATSLKWHSNGTTDYTITRGNNVYAYEDRNADNIAGASDTSTTPDPLTFHKLYDFAQEPIVTVNQRAATTNLFYWNNIIHDLFYLYGFNEPAGNFQANNQGRGGAGNDAVNAEAQDGAGSNNANFNTPVDGSPGRMQMFLWTAPTPDKDGDLDNGIIIHEYGHGISNRFTGGPANSSCLGNQEQMGEGWSDYVALMMTQNWATSLVTDGFNSPRGIGTYALNQPVTGVGIRQYPYCTNMAVNPMTYTNVSTVAVPHGVGTVWCTILWDMTWNMIQMDGIAPDIYNVSAVAGNTAALKLVVEGMRLQPCSPGFVDGRNAILKADTLFFGARYSCAIWNAFARRGVGVNASQGLSTSRSDQTVDFTSKNFDMPFTQNVTQQYQNQDITYTITTQAICSALTNYRIVDTLPTNVTHLSGGTYNAGNRTVTFSPINLAAGSSQVNTFTVRVNNGSYFTPLQHINETVAGATIPASWTATSTTTNVWTVSTAQSISAPNSFFTPDAAVASDQILTTTGSFTLNGSTTLTFQGNYITENTWDGGVVEISINGGTTWTDLGNFMTSNGYNGTLGSGSALAGRRAFTGNSSGFRQTSIDLSSFNGKTVRIRFRFASDTNTGGTGWYVDNIVMTTEPAVIHTAQLFNASNVLQTSKTLSARILPGTLPLQLLSFGGLLQGTDARLQWKTTEEKETDRFEIERSFNGILFEKAGQLPAANRLQGQDYTFTDFRVTSQPLYNRTVYYRLKMVDKDGMHTYSRIVRLGSGSDKKLILAPNPVKDQLHLFGFTDNKTYSMRITDMAGQIVKQGQVSFASNSIDLQNLASGQYLLYVESNLGRSVYRFLKE